MGNETNKSILSTKLLKWAPRFEIIKVSFVMVSLPLEGYVAIGFMEIEAILHQSDYPFDYIYNIKRDDKEFAHLGSMDPFVVEQRGGNRNITFHKQDATKVDGGVSASNRQDVIPNYYHDANVANFHKHSKTFEG